MIARSMVLCASLIVLSVAPRIAVSETDTDFGKLPTFTSASGKWEAMVHKEGLPHPEAERDLFAEEREAKETVRLRGFWYYKADLALTGDDAAAIGKLLADSKSFHELRGKFCGGFHPDYSIEWRVGKAAYFADVCLGCHEIKFFGPGVQFHCDIEEPAYDKLREVLLNYRKQRPPSKLLDRP